jgi:hypothetical protein
MSEKDGREIRDTIRDSLKRSDIVFGPTGDYYTECPFCHADGKLFVIKGVFVAYKMPLRPDGFCFDDAKHISTENETVHCEACGLDYPLSEVMVS